MKKITFGLTLILTITSYFLSAQVVINEFSAANLNVFLDNYNKSEDWIELYNASDQAVDISEMHLSDKSKKPGKWKIPEGTIIEGNSFLVFWCSGRDEVKDGHYHTNFKLSQTSGKDEIIFADKDEEILEAYEIPICMVEHSRCRITDGNEVWKFTSTPSPNYSNDTSFLFQGYTKTPKMNMEAGFYDEDITVSIENLEENSILTYTLDGTNPTAQSPVYSEPIKVSKTTVIKAASFSNVADILPGKMEFNTYFINEHFSLDVFSVAADDVLELANGDGDLIPIGTLEYFKNRQRKATSFGSLNRHGQDSWVLPHRSLDWVSRDEMGYSKAVQAPLFSYSKRDEYQKFMFRNSGDDNYPADDEFEHEGSTHIRDEYVQTLAMEGGLKLDQRAVERVILFLNGKYWGLYGMRERPVDHDYTKEYYNQGKYDLQYLTTWGETQAQYGDTTAFQDWYELRDFILENDMSIDENYNRVKDDYNVLSLIDYMIVNLNSVASDWLNYNTGWWRGTNEKGDHKKWGYILWDLDATFDYYINYSGVPNTSPNAQPCDINDISEAMDQFFGEDFSGNPDSCFTITEGLCPYSSSDSIFLKVISADDYCCTTDWDEDCQAIYDYFSNQDTIYSDTCATILNGSCPYTMDDEILQKVIQYEESCCSSNWGMYCQSIYNEIADSEAKGYVSGNVGKHEKIFLKLQEENEEFKQLYYSRQADLMNTVYSCDNMLNTLDSMLAIIEPEMPKQIERWGGSMTEWQQNVDKLKDFIDKRCGLLAEGMTDCFEVTGPFDLTIMVQPEGVGQIDINTISPKDLPWNAAYFGGMNNKIKAKVKKGWKDFYKFSHWESKSGNSILPNPMSGKATIELTKADTLIAVFESFTATEELAEHYNLDVYPNPANGTVHLRYNLPNKSDVNIELFSVYGKLVKVLKTEKRITGQHLDTYKLNDIAAGIYFIKLKVDEDLIIKKLTIVN